MENKITKNLIILGAIVFSFVFAHNALAYSCYGYSCDNGYSPTYYPNDNNSGYTNGYYQPEQYGNYTSYYSSNNNNVYNPGTQTQPTTPAVVNNYYYPTPKTTNTTTSNTTSQTSTTNTPANTPTNTNAVSNNGVYPNNNGALGASAYNGYSQNGNGIAALSLAGSGGFMPSSVWQWIFVVILILAIVIIGRMFVHKPSPDEHDIHNIHAH